MPTPSQFAHCRGASQKHKNSGGGERERKREGKKREGKILFQLNSKKEKKLREEEELNISRNNSKL